MNDFFFSIGRSAISDAYPCGSDVRSEPEFESLQIEISKLSNPTAGGKPDWDKVVSLSATLLESKGKDVLVACYLSVGLLVTRGLSGLLEGTRVLADLFQLRWEEIHPPLARLRARRNALLWLVDRVRAHGDEHEWSNWPAQDPALIAGLRMSLDTIDRVLADKDNEAPSMQLLAALVSTVPVFDIEPPPILDPVAPPSLAASPAVAAEAHVPALLALAESGPMRVHLDSSEMTNSVVGEALQRLTHLGSFYTESDLSNPLGFRLRRLGMWAGIEHRPPAVGKDTALPGPIAPLQDALDNLLSQGSHIDLVRFAETQLLRHPFWLDLNYAAVMALEALGENWTAARREVCNETTKFVDRMMGIEELKFANGTPFAGVRTLQWLQSQSSSSVVAAASGPLDPLAAVVARAHALGAKGDLVGAAQCLHDAIEQSLTVAAQLRLRTVLCDVLRQNHPPPRIDSFARTMVSEIDRYKVSIWDPALAADGLRAAYQILSRGDENSAEAEGLLGQIVLLNAATAVQLVGSRRLGSSESFVATDLAPVKRIPC